MKNKTGTKRDHSDWAFCVYPLTKYNPFDVLYPRGLVPGEVCPQLAVGDQLQVDLVLKGPGSLS